MLDLACLLISQELFSQLAGITDAPRLQKFPCETNILSDIDADPSNTRVDKEKDVAQTKKQLL